MALHQQGSQQPGAGALAGLVAHCTVAVLHDPRNGSGSAMQQTQALANVCHLHGHGLCILGCRFEAFGQFHLASKMASPIGDDLLHRIEGLVRSDQHELDVHIHRVGPRVRLAPGLG